MDANSPRREPIFRCYMDLTVNVSVVKAKTRAWSLAASAVRGCIRSPLPPPTPPMCRSCISNGSHMSLGVTVGAPPIIDMQPTSRQSPLDGLASNQAGSNPLNLRIPLFRSGFSQVQAPAPKSSEINPKRAVRGPKRGLINRFSTVNQKESKPVKRPRARR